MEKQECPRAKSNMTPCYAKDGVIATYTTERGGTQCCIGCETAIIFIERKPEPDAKR